MTEKYIEQGINIIAVNEFKQAVFAWKVYQTEKISLETFNKQMQDYKSKGVAVICGEISGNLEVIDIDTKYQTYDLWEEIKKRIPSQLFEKLHIVRTKNNGYHLYYKCEHIEKNQKLAQRYPTADESKNNPSIKTYCIIETRGEAGYVVAPPSSGYSFVQEGLNVITSYEREELIDIMRSFNEVIVEAIIEAHNRPSTKEYGLSPFEDFNNRGDIVKLLSDYDWKVVGENSERIYFLRPGSTAKSSGSWNKQMQLFSVFSVNTPFQVEKGYKLSAVYAFLECNGDFKKAALNLVNMGFGEKKTAYTERTIKLNDEPPILTFWDIDKKGQPIINRYKLQIFLTNIGGFRLFFYDKSSTIYRLVRIKDGMVEEASTEQIKRFIKDYIDKLPDEFDGSVTPQDLLEIVYKGANILFSDAFFEFFDKADIDFLRDDKHTSYIPYKNGVVVVKKDTILLKTYGELNKYVWKSQVLDHYVIVDQDDANGDKTEYFQFIKKISGNDIVKVAYAISIIGYLLHQYKDPSKPYAVILAEENDNDEQGGGTGKGIFVKALGYLLNIVRVDGKNFKIDKSFAFQRVDLDTKIIAIEDTRKKVDFEGFYSIITEGVTVEKKNKDELFIPYKDSPKILFTTNYSIPQSGVHAKRRQRVFEFSPYFGQKHTPEDEFNHKLFDDWDHSEWNRFFNFLFFCIQDFILNGIQEMPFSDKMLRKSIKNQWGDDFNEYFDEIIKNKDWISLDFLHQEFMNLYGLDKKDYSRIKFTKAVKSGCEILKVVAEEKKNYDDKGKKVVRFVKNDDLQPHSPHLVDF